MGLLDYLEGMKLDQLSPDPDSVTARSEGYLYPFLASSTKKALTVAFDFTPSAQGLSEGRGGVAFRSTVVNDGGNQPSRPACSTARGPLAAWVRTTRSSG